MEHCDFRQFPVICGLQGRDLKFLMPHLTILLAGTGPHVAGNADEVEVRSVPGEVAADVRDVPAQEAQGIGVDPWVHGLRKVDDPDALPPVKNVERRQIRVDAIARKTRLDPATGGPGLPKDACTAALWGGGCGRALEWKAQFFVLRSRTQ